MQPFHAIVGARSANARTSQSGVGCVARGFDDLNYAKTDPRLTLDITRRILHPERITATAQDSAAFAVFFSTEWNCSLGTLMRVALTFCLCPNPILPDVNRTVRLVILPQSGRNERERDTRMVAF